MIAEKVLIRPGNIIFDMDEVLFNISPYMYKKIRLNWATYMPFLKDLGPLKDEQVLERPYFPVTNWLIKPLGEYQKLDPVVHQLVYKMIKDLCFNDTMYDTLQPTWLCQNTLLNREFLANPAVESCTILTRYPTTHPGMLDAKEKIFKKYFTHPKIKLVPATSEEKKSDILNKMGIDWSLIIDDEIPNIRDFAENCSLQRREFLIPKLGYNKMPPELRLLIMEKGGTISYYKNVL